MSEDFVLIDNIYRSRMTLLDILERRGYDVEKYRKFSPAEAAAAVATYPSLTSLNFKVYKKDDESKVCDVRYASISRQKLDTFFDDIDDDDSENTEVVVMIPTAVADAHHSTALKQYMKQKESGERRKLRVAFFNIETIVINPMNHYLVPKHEIVPQDYHKTLMESLHITSKSKFPEIKFHVDPIGRCIGAVPGDIIKITRPSPASGEAIVYRVCAP